MSLPPTIYTIALRATGDFDVIQKIERPFPLVGKDDVVIKLQYGGVNFIDNYFRTGIYPTASFPAVMGEEGAGLIISLPTDPEVIGDANYIKRGLTVGARAVLTTHGSFAEYVSVPWTKVFPLPEGVSSRTGAAALAQGSTAITFVQEAYNVKSGDIIFVHTVAGGFGLLITQIAKLRGATVIGSTSTKEKAEVAKSNGADHVILYKDEDTVQRVLEITGGQGVHAVYDGVGKDGYEIDFQIIRRKGTIVFVGNASGVVPPIPPLKLAEKNVTILRPTVGKYLFTPEEHQYYLDELFKLVAEGQLKILIHKEYPFTAEGVQQAEKDLTGGKTVGKLLINIADE